MAKNESTGSTREYTLGHQVYQKFSSQFGRIFSTDLNPLYHLGGMAILMFITACGSGFYIFLFYDVNPRHAWDSVEAISGSYLNGLVRSVHRYSSDLLVIFIILHLLHTLISGKFKRMVSWISGVISFLIVIVIGVTGYMLVWDQKAKLTGYLTARFLSGIPIFDPAIVGAFLLNNLNALGGFFKVALFGHIALSLITLIVIWVHVMRISNPKLLPPKKLIVYTSIALVFISIVFPVKSDAPAQGSNLPINTSFDWYYHFGYYLLKLFNVQQNWAIMLGSGLLLCILPFIIKRKKRPPVQIDLAKCDACNLCSYDCPYEAIDMLIKEGQKKAILSPEKCVGCSICIGSCKEHAISHPEYPIIDFSRQENKGLTVFSCSYFPGPVFPPDVKITHYRVPCIGGIMPKDIQVLLDQNSKGAALLGCEDCYYRLGNIWTVKRFLRKRALAFSKKYNASRIALFNQTKYSKEKLRVFFNSIKDENGANELQRWDNNKSKQALSVLILAIFFSLMVPISNASVRFFNPVEQILLVNLKYVSSPTEFEQPHTSGGHMQVLNPLVKSRSPVSLKIYSSKDRTLLFEKQYKPRGLRSDIAIFIYLELLVKAEYVDVELTETAFPQKQFRIDNVHMKKGDGTFVVFENSSLTLSE